MNSKHIYLLTDYKGHFGTKWAATPYRSGMDKEKLKKAFKRNEYKTEFISFNQIEPTTAWNNKIILYTSSEDAGGFYRDYIEDVLWGLKMVGARLLPDLHLFRAHHNKVFMEFLRDLTPELADPAMKSFCFGTLEELQANHNKIQFPCVLKIANETQGAGVCLIKNWQHLESQVKKLTKVDGITTRLWDLGRSLRRKGYTRNSPYRNKFIIQRFVPKMENDWKILLFGNRAFLLKRYNRPKDFRASGSGLLEYIKDIPIGILEYARKIQLALNTPHLSLDLLHSKGQFHLIEYQALYFGTHTVDTAPFGFHYKHGKWVFEDGPFIVEDVYAESVTEFIKNNYSITN